MYKSLIASLLAVSTVSAAIVPPAVAEAGSSVLTASAGGRATLPSGTVISVTSQQSGVVTVKKKEASPLQLVVSESLKDSSGKILVHAGTPLIGRMEAAKGGARIVIEKMVVDNRLLPFEAVSVQSMPVSKVPVDQYTAENELQNNLSNAAANSVSQLGYNVSRGVGGGVISGVGSALVGSLFKSGPKTVKVVEMSAGQPHMLMTESAVTVAIASNPPKPPELGGGQFSGGDQFPGGEQFPPTPAGFPDQGFPNF